MYDLEISFSTKASIVLFLKEIRVVKQSFISRKNKPVGEYHIISILFLRKSAFLENLYIIYFDL